MKGNSYSDEEYLKFKIFTKDITVHTIGITPENVAYFYVEYCKQNNIKVNESKIDNYVERMQQHLISKELK